MGHSEPSARTSALRKPTRPRLGHCGHTPAGRSWRWRGQNRLMGGRGGRVGRCAAVVTAAILGGTASAPRSRPPSSPPAQSRWLAWACRRCPPCVDPAETEAVPNSPTSSGCVSKCRRIAQGSSRRDPSCDPSSCRRPPDRRRPPPERKAQSPTDDDRARPTRGPQPWKRDHASCPRSRGRCRR